MVLTVISDRDQAQSLISLDQDRDRDQSLISLDRDQAQALTSLGQDQEDRHRWICFMRVIRTWHPRELSSLVMDFLRQVVIHFS